MSNSPEELSVVKRALLEKLVRGEVATTVKHQGEDVHIDATPVNVPVVDSLVPLISIQADGKKSPFFYIHVHWEGGAFYCFRLAQELGPDQPFYVLDPCKLEDFETIPTLEEMATEYVKTLRAVQPTGPYQLGGFCGGCLIALEVAQQLIAAGEKVDQLLLIEPGITGPMHSLFEPYGAWYLRLSGCSTRFIGRILRQNEQRTCYQFLFVRHLYRALRHPSYRRDPDFTLKPTFEQLCENWIGVFVWIISAYRPRPYAGQITYLWAQKAPKSRQAAWNKVGVQAEYIAYRQIAGDHDSCRREDLSDLAYHIQECLDVTASPRRKASL